MLLPRTDEETFKSGCLRRDGDRFRQRRWRQLQVHDQRFADEQLQSFTHDGREALQFGCDLVGAHTRRDAVHAAVVGDRREGVAGGLEDRRHDHTRQHAARGIGDRARERRLLRVRDDRQQRDSAREKQPPDDPECHDVS
jgi:hypothetical protein